MDSKKMRKKVGYYLILLVGVGIMVTTIFIARLLGSFLYGDGSIPNAIFALGIVCGYYVSWIIRFSAFLVDDYKAKRERNEQSV